MHYLSYQHTHKTEIMVKLLCFAWKWWWT